MALDKQLCCFGFVVVLLWLGSVHSAVTRPSQKNKQQWVPPQGISHEGTSWWNSQKQKPVQHHPEPKPKQEPRYPSHHSPEGKLPETPENPETVCDVDSFDKVSCGPGGTTAMECKEMGCCYDGSQCYYGNTVTLHCTRDAIFVIVVSKDVTAPRLNLETIGYVGGVADPACAAVDSNAAFAIYQFQATQCGTTYRTEGDYLIYENTMSSTYDVTNGPYGSITRDSRYELSIQCRYFGSAVLALVVEVNPVPPPNDLSLEGPLNVELRLGSGECSTKGCNEDAVAYQTYYSESDYPVTKILKDPVYAEVRMLGRTDPNIVLTLGRCWTTTTSDPDSLPQWDLLIDGCPYTNDRHLTTLIPVTDVEHPYHYRRFMLKMFTFVNPQSNTPLQEMVYIHCKASVCQPMPGNNCEPMCSRMFKRDVSAVQEKDEKETVVVSSGAVRFRT